MPGSGWDRGGSDERPGPVSRHRSLPVPTLGPDQIVTLPVFGVGLAKRLLAPSFFVVSMHRVDSGDTTPPHAGVVIPQYVRPVMGLLVESFVHLQMS